MNQGKSKPANDQYEVEEIKSRRTNRKTKAYEYLVKWKGWSSQFNTWEPRRNLIDLQDEVNRFDKDWDRKMKLIQKVSDEIKIQDFQETVKKEVAGISERSESQQTYKERPRKRIIFRLRKKKRKVHRSHQNEDTNAESGSKPIAMLLESLTEIKIEEPEVHSERNTIENTLPNLQGQVKILEGDFYKGTMIYKIARPQGNIVWATRQQLRVLRPDALDEFYLEYFI